MKFDVFLPSLLVSPDWFTDAAPPRLPAIETLLARGVPTIGGEWPGALLNAIGVSDVDATRAIAAFAAHGDSIVTGTQGWLFAEPAHFHADRDTVHLFPASHLDISTSEAAQLIDALNENFADRGLAFSCGTSGNWYVTCNATELPLTTPIRTAQRGAVFEKLPQSRGKVNWKAIQNEAQMLFHSHAVNEARESAGKMTINGLWFWGEGILPAPPIALNPYVVFGDSALANGVAKWGKARFAPLTQLGFADPVSPANHNLVVISALERFQERGDVNAWIEAVGQLELQIFAPLLASLGAGKVEQVALTLPRARDSLVVTIDAQALRGLSGWWKSLTQKPQPFVGFSLD